MFGFPGSGKKDSNDKDAQRADSIIFPFFPTMGGNPHQMFNSFFASRSRGSWVPAVDITEQDDAYTLIADLPEVSKSDLRVYTESASVLCIAGNRQHLLKQDDSQLLFSERGAGRFERCFDLPAPVDDGKVSASFSDAQLVVNIPKLRSSKAGAGNSVRID